MGADILERLDFMLISRRSDEDAIIRDARAEIVRLRGEVDSLRGWFDASRAPSNMSDDHDDAAGDDADDIAPAEAKGDACPRCRGTGETCTGTIDGIPELFDCRDCLGSGMFTAPVGATIADAASDPSLTLDAARQLLRDVAHAIESGRYNTPQPAGGEAVADVVLHDGLLYGRLRGDLPVGTKLYTTPAAVPAGEAVAYSVVQIGNRGAAYDPPNTHRAFTYEHQPGNIDASRLGRATNAAAVASAGDSIDRGLSLLKELQAIGFGVFQIGPPAPVQAAPQEGEVAYWERWHPTHGVVSVNREPLGESIVDNRWEDRPLYRANPSACELVVDDAMVERACLYHFPDWDMYGPAGKMVRSADIRRLLTAALQHRGDSQEVGRV